MNVFNTLCSDREGLLWFLAWFGLVRGRRAVFALGVLLRLGAGNTKYSCMVGAYVGHEGVTANRPKQK